MFRGLERNQKKNPIKFFQISIRFRWKNTVHERQVEKL
jgi:hypothetical protein